MASSTSLESITLYTAAHGSADKHLRRSSNPHKYPDNFNVLFLSFAGLANIHTEMGIMSKGEGAIADKLRDKGTDYGTLAYLTSKIFKEVPAYPDLTEARRFMNVFMKEIMKLGKDLAHLEFSKTSPPVIRENPEFDKRWWFADNAGDELRESGKRSNPSRDAGFTPHNPIMAIPGLYVLQTSRPELKRWSLSDITGSDERTPEGLLTMPAIKKRNLLRKINYTSFWRPYIDGFDFSNVPDADVIEIGNVTEAVLILQQIHYAFISEYAMDDPNDESEINRFVEEAGEDILAPPVPVPSPPHPPREIEMFDKLLVHRDAASKAIALVKKANEDVTSKRANFVAEANRADLLEEEIKRLQNSLLTRHQTKVVANMTTFLEQADTELDELRGQLDEAKKSAARLESELDEIKSRIVADVVTFIENILTSETDTPLVKAVIKNIIMRNKLKNILKIGILHKVLRLRQVIIFFRGLGYNILNIVDPSCFVVKEKPQLDEHVNTQQLPDSQDGLGEGDPEAKSVDWHETLDKLTKQSPLKRLKPADGSAGGTKRKRTTRSYSRKRYVFRRNKRTKKHRYYTKRRKI